MILVMKNLISCILFRRDIMVAQEGFMTNLVFGKGYMIHSICISRPCYIYFIYSWDWYSRLGSILKLHFPRPPFCCPTETKLPLADVTSTVQHEMVKSDGSCFEWTLSKWIWSRKNTRQASGHHIVAVALVLKSKPTWDLWTFQKYYQFEFLPKTNIS